MRVETLEMALLSLLLIISAVGIAVRALRIPYPIALVLTGLAFGALFRLPFFGAHDLAITHIQLTPELILLLLPALLFEGTLHLEVTALRKTLVPIAMLALPGVVVTAAVVGALMHWGIGLAWANALLFGAVVAATDPIAVLAIFKRLAVPHDLEVLVEGESLFNDGTAVVLARILTGVVLVGNAHIMSGIANFGLVVGGGLVVGLITGAVASRLTAQIDDHLIEITLTTILTYGTFLVAEALHVSGVIAVVMAGLVLGNVGAKRGMSPTTRLALLTFWEYVAFLINSLIFLLIGLQTNVGSLAENGWPISIAIGAVLLARAVVVYGLGLAILPLPTVLPLRWLHALFWSGLRGALSLAVVLALPFDFPARALMLDLTLGVVLFTLLVQGLTMGPVLRRLQVVGQDIRYRAYTQRRAHALMLRAARRELQRLAANHLLSRRVYAELDRHYRQADETLEDELEALYQDNAALEAEQLRATREQLLRVERTVLADLQQHGAVDGTGAQHLAELVDSQLLALQLAGDQLPDTYAPRAVSAEQPKESPIERPQPSGTPPGA